MTIKHFVNRKTLLVADTNPSALATQPVILEELDSGNFYSSNGSTISIFTGPDKSETLKNKIIPPDDNEFLHFNTPLDHPFLRNFEQKGHVIPAATVPDSFHGLIDGCTLYNPTTVKAVNNVGIVAGFESLVDAVKLGFASPVPIARRDKGYEIKMEVKSNAKTVLVGFSTAAAFDPANIFGATDKGVAIGWTLANPWICAYNHDGNGAVRTTTSAIKSSSVVHTFEIILGTANIICIVDDAQTLTLEFDLPGLTDNLYLLIYGIQ